MAAAGASGGPDWGTEMYCEMEAIELPLTECAEGDDVCVVALDSDSPLSARLRVLGVLAGVPLRIARAGSPLIIEVGETRLCLRGSEAEQVRVRVIGSSWPAAALSVVEGAGLA